MRTVGLTGGIGSGKSAVTALLADLGAAVIDADLLAREVVAPGTTGLAGIVAAFGEQVLQPDGTLDRPGLARRVFSDPDELKRLNAIVHPLIGDRTAELTAQAQAQDRPVLVHDVALLVENGLDGRYDEVVVVAATEATQLDRLTRLREMTRDDALARIRAQVSLEDRLRVADHVIHNDGPIEQLEPQVRDLWATLTG